MSFTQFIRASVVGITLAIGLPAIAGDMTGVYTVELNNTQIIRLSEPASAVIVGNPKIADISVHSSDTVFVVGRGYGQTNLIVLNSSGATIVNAKLQVTSATSPGNVRLYQGPDRKSFSCAPYCLPAPVLGDSTIFIGQNTPEAPEISTTSISGPSVSSQSTVGMAVTESEFEDQSIQRRFYPE